jgi:hypothetical protein
MVSLSNREASSPLFEKFRVRATKTVPGDFILL